MAPAEEDVIRPVAPPPVFIIVVVVAVAPPKPLFKKIKYACIIDLNITVKIPTIQAQPRSIIHNYLGFVKLLKGLKFPRRLNGLKTYSKAKAPVIAPSSGPTQNTQCMFHL